ncbi:MAG: hypothetical protein ABFS56_32970, partial [Pseudomonadota bacterium]
MRKIILNELPALMQNDLSIREVVLEISRTQFADRYETDTRFEQMMARLDRLMDEDRKKWEESQKRWELITSRKKCALLCEKVNTKHTFFEILDNHLSFG